MKTKKYIEKEVVLEKKEVINSVVCDVCHRTIVTATSETEKNNWYNYFDVTTQHGDWGNDSCDSIERHQICGTKCLKQFMDNYLETAGLNTDEINIEIDCIAGVSEYALPSAWKKRGWITDDKM